MKHVNISKSKLKILYWKRELSLLQIANIFKCSVNKILSMMHKYNINRRDSITARRLRVCSGKLATHYIDGISLKNNYCLDCGQKVCYDSIRCRECSYKFRKGKVRPKINRILLVSSKRPSKKVKKHYCKECGKMVSYHAKLCKVCYNKLCGEKTGNYIDGRSTKMGVCIDCGKSTSMGAEAKGFKRCRSCANSISGLKRWQDEEYRKKQIQASFKGLNVRQNKIEKRLEKVLYKLFPGEYSFVGDGKIFVNGFIPDFINVNGQKKIIELFGDYWHNLDSHKRTDKNRLKTYKKYGYKTLIVWEHELKDFYKLKQKLINYHNSQEDLK